MSILLPGYNVVLAVQWDEALSVEGGEKNLFQRHGTLPFRSRAASTA
jgi:hypothetical protein